MPFAPTNPVPGIDAWITREPDWPDEAEREYPRPAGVSWPASEDARFMPCDTCQGEGRIWRTRHRYGQPPEDIDEGPCPNPACVDGLEEVAAEPLTEDDLEEAFGP